jgi:hypothetical protein
MVMEPLDFSAQSSLNLVAHLKGILTSEFCSLYFSTTGLSASADLEASAVDEAGAAEEETAGAAEEAAGAAEEAGAALLVLPEQPASANAMTNRNARTFFIALLSFCFLLGMQIS